MPLVKRPPRSSSAPVPPSQFLTKAPPRSSTMPGSAAVPSPTHSPRSSILSFSSQDSSLPATPRSSISHAPPTPAGRHLGTLVAVVLKARHLPDKHVCSKQNPYARIVFSGEFHKTKTDVRGGQHPEWDEELRFPVYDDLDKPFRTMEVSVWAAEKRGQDELVGEGSIDISPALKRGEFDDWIPLSRNGIQRGEIYIELTYFSARPPSIITTASTFVDAAPVAPTDPAAPVELTGIGAIGIPADVLASIDSVKAVNLPPPPPPAGSEAPATEFPPSGFTGGDTVIPGSFGEENDADTPTQSAIKQDTPAPTQSAVKTETPTATESAVHWMSSVVDRFSQLVVHALPSKDKEEVKEDDGPAIPGGLVD